MYNIMVIDSDPESGRKIKAALNSGEFRVWTLCNGAEGLKKMEEWLPDLLILDIELADMDGQDILKKLKDNTKTAGLPVIVVSFKSEENIRAALLELGAGDVLPKPFNSRELAARVRSQLKYVNNHAAAAGSVGDMYKIGRNVTVEFGTNEVNIAGEAIVLSKREMDVFSGLIRNDGKVPAGESRIPESIRTILGKEEVYSHICAMNNNADSAK